MQAALNLAGSLTCSGRDVRDLFEMGTPVLYNCVTCRTKVKIAKSAREARSFSTGRARAKKGQGSRSGLRSWITVSCNCASRARPATQVQKAYCSHELLRNPLGLLGFRRHAFAFGARGLLGTSSKSQSTSTVASSRLVRDVRAVRRATKRSWAPH